MSLHDGLENLKLIIIIVLLLVVIFVIVSSWYNLLHFTSAATGANPSSGGNVSNILKNFNGFLKNLLGF